MAYDFEKHAYLAQAYNHDVKCLTLVWAGIWLWALGWPEQARLACFEQLSHARRVGHAFNLLWGLSGGTMGLLLRRDTDVIREWLEELRVVGREQGMPIAELLYSWWDGYASVVEGRYEHAYAQLAPSVKYWKDCGARHLLPYANLMMAQALSGMDRLDEAITPVDEAVQLIERTNHRPHEAEVHRVRGMLLSQGQHPDRVASESALLKAIDVARSQHARGWEFRAATSLAADLADSGRASSSSWSSCSGL